MASQKEALGYCKKFKATLDNVKNTKAFENFDLYIAEQIEEIYPGNNQANRNFTKQISKKLVFLENKLTKDVNGSLEYLKKGLGYFQDSQNKAEIVDFIKYFYKIITDSKLDVKNKTHHNEDLVNYFNDLETQQDSLKSVKKVADDIALTNRNINLELSKTKAELKITKENLDRKTKKSEKFKQVIQEYRDTTMKLAHHVEADLERLHGMDLNEIPKYLKGINDINRQHRNNDEEYFSKLDALNSPGKTQNSKVSADKENLWFDIEKSQVRYEAMLDSYMGIIKDKDEYIKKIENDFQSLKKDRLDVEDEHFNQIREKDKLLSESEALRNDLTNKLNSQSKTDKGKIKSCEEELDDLRQKVSKKNEALQQKYLGQTEQLAQLTESEINLKKQLGSLTDDLNEIQKELIDARVKICELENFKHLEIKISELECENELLKKSNESERNKVCDKEEENLNQTDQVKDLDRKLTNLTAESITNKHKIEDLQNQLTELKIDYKNLQIEEIDLRKQLNGKLRSEADYTKLEEQRDYEINSLEKMNENHENKIEDLESDIKAQEKKCCSLAKEVDSYRFGQPTNTNQSFDVLNRSKGNTPNVKKSYNKADKENYHEGSISPKNDEYVHEQPNWKHSLNTPNSKQKINTPKSKPKNPSVDYSNMPTNFHVPTGEQAFNYVNYSDKKTDNESNGLAQDQGIELDESPSPGSAKDQKNLDFKIKHFGDSECLRTDQDYDLVNINSSRLEKKSDNQNISQEVNQNISREEKPQDQEEETDNPTLDFENVICPEEPEAECFPELNKVETEDYVICL